MSQAASNSSHKGRHVTSWRALKFLFASGILGGHGSGKHRAVGYNRKRAATIKTMRARGIDVTRKQGFRRFQGASRPGKPFSTFNNANNAAKHNKGFGRAVIGGNSARLQGSGRGAVKPDHSATRAARVAAGQAVLEQHRRAPGQKALRVSGYLHAVAMRREGVSVKDAAKGERERIQTYEARAARNARIDKGLSVVASHPRARSFAGLQQHLGRDEAIQAIKNRGKRIAAGKAKYAEFHAKRDAAYGGGLFGQSTSKADHSPTRAEQLAANREKRATRYEKLAAKHRTDATHHARASNEGIGRMGQPVNANSRAGREFRAIQKGRDHATKAYQAADKAAHFEAKAQHARTAGLQQELHRQQKQDIKHHLQSAEVGSQVQYYGQTYTLKKKRKNNVLLEHPQHGLVTIPTKI